MRDERAGDEAAIESLIAAAFRDTRYSDGTEGAIVERLRADGDLSLSLVAENMDGAIVGHVAFSPVAISDGTAHWYGLGPVSVIPLRQRSGIGSGLIEEGLARLQKAGARGCVVLGEPAYYGRFGFRHDPRLVFPGPSPEYFQMLAFVGEVPAGTVSYAGAFG